MMNEEQGLLFEAISGHPRKVTHSGCSQREG